jgi:tRNA G10  N-methylase Trm11
MGNIAQIQNDQTVLDPFAGSCTTLLAAAMLAPGCKTVGIELAPNYTVNRDDIRRDFSSRQLTQPVALIEGDSTCEKIRTEARAAVGGGSFDVIIADPPYGIRERKDAQEPPPLVKLVSIIARDYDTGTPLLAKNGRLVAFVPNQLGEDLSLSMPTPRQLEDAGLKMTALREQPLSDVLSRWLVAYKSIR